MNRLATFAVLALVLAMPDRPKFYDVRSPLHGFMPMPEGPIEPGSAQPGVFVAVVQHSGQKATSLQPRSRMEIIRYVSGEFAHAVRPMPAEKKGLRIAVGRPFDEKGLNQLVANHGAAVAPGDSVQITRLDFRERSIVVDLNGGAKGKFRLRDHMQVGVGGGAGPVITSSSSGGGAPKQAGVTIVLDYGKPLPDLSPDEVKTALSPLLDFSKEKSAAVDWLETLPPEYKQAIESHRAAVGMDHDMVIAALGRPDHKVRERNPQGDETEDWIYGNPPAKTVFVTFLGDKVVRVKEFN